MPYSPYNAGAIAFIQILSKLRSSVSSIQGRRNCIYTSWLKIKIRNIVHTMPAQLYSYKIAQNYYPPYNTYKAGAIVFIQISSKVRSALSYIQCPTHCIHTDLHKITVRSIVHTRPAPLHSYKLAQNYDQLYRPYKAGFIALKSGYKLRYAV